MKRWLKKRNRYGSEKHTHTAQKNDHACAKNNNFSNRVQCHQMGNPE